MTTSVALAAAAGIAGVLAAWDALGIAEGGLLRLLAAVGPHGALARRLEPLFAGRALSRAERRRTTLFAGSALLVAGTVLIGPLAGVVLATAAPLLARHLLVGADRRRRARLAAGAPAVARAVADALAGGHSIRGALTAAAREGSVTGPAGQELRTVAAALALGDETGVVLERLRARAAHPAFDALVAAVLLQRDSGGDLATLLRTLATTLEEQARVDADARTMTAQARFTALLVAVLPALAACVAELANPGYLSALLSRPLTAWLAAMSVLLQGAAWFAVRRIARVRT